MENEANNKEQRANPMPLLLMFVAAFVVLSMAGVGWMLYGGPEMTPEEKAAHDKCIDLFPNNDLKACTANLVKLQKEIETEHSLKHIP